MSFGDIIPIFLFLAAVVCLYGIVRYIAAGGDWRLRKKIGTHIFYTLIALGVMVAVWGLVALFLDFCV